MTTTKSDAFRDPSAADSSSENTILTLSHMIATPSDATALADAHELLGRALAHDPPLLDPVVEAHARLDYALAVSKRSTAARLLHDWAPIIYIVMTGIAQILFIEMYCRWHGARFLLPNPFQLYDPANVEKLANMTFVAYADNAPTTMSVAAEVLMWSSVGVWAHRLFGMSRRYRRNPPNVPYDVSTYIGILARNTSMAAAAIIILRLSDFSVFGVSLDRFDATVGTSFLLGFFGDDTYALFCKIRDTLISQGPADKSGTADT